MKSLIAIAITLVGIQAQAFEIMKCTEYDAPRGKSIDLTVTTDRASGEEKINVVHATTDHYHNETYEVHSVPPLSCEILCADIPVSYVGERIRLTVDFTAAPLGGGTYVGTLETNAFGVDQVLCKKLTP